MFLGHRPRLLHDGSAHIGERMVGVRHLPRHPVVAPLLHPHVAAGVLVVNAGNAARIDVLRNASPGAFGVVAIDGWRLPRHAPVNHLAHAPEPCPSPM